AQPLPAGNHQAAGRCHAPRHTPPAANPPAQSHPSPRRSPNVRAAAIRRGPNGLSARRPAIRSARGPARHSADEPEAPARILDPGEIPQGGRRMTEPKRVAVVGAGIVGVSSALHLQRDGHAVTLIDPRAPGTATSFGNAGVIASSAVAPNSTPALRREIP